MTAVAGAKNIRIVGDGGLAGQFFDAGLLTELIVQIGSLNLVWSKTLRPRRFDFAAASTLVSKDGRNGLRRTSLRSLARQAWKHRLALRKCRASDSLALDLVGPMGEAPGKRQCVDAPFMKQESGGTAAPPSVAVHDIARVGIKREYPFMAQAVQRH